MTPLVFLNHFKVSVREISIIQAVLAYEPQLTLGPEMTKDGYLHFAGFFPSASSQIKFDMYFSPVNGQWKLFGLAADIGPAGPVAPMPAPLPSKPTPPSQTQPSKGINHQ